MKKYIVSFFLLAAIFSLPLTTYAQLQESLTPPQDSFTPPPATPTTPNTPKTPPKSITVGGPDGMIQNPLKGADSLGELFKTLSQFVLDVAYIVIAAFLLLSGFKFIKAQGNPEELAKAKATFWYTIIGALIIIAMDTLVGAFRTILQQLGS
jgi:hypothetical protein